jgi:hypothetical protein
MKGDKNMNKKTDEIKKSGDEDFQAFVDLYSAIMLGEDKRAKSVMRKAVKKATKEPDNIDIPKGYTIDTERWKQFPQLESGMLVFVSNGCWGKISEDYETGRLYFYRKGGAISLGELQKQTGKGLEELFIEVYVPKNQFAIHSYNPENFNLHYTCLKKKPEKVRISLAELLKRAGLEGKEVEIH